jgi:hypothetical protein
MELLLIAKERCDNVSQPEHVVLHASELGTLITTLVRWDYEVVGPTVRDGAIIYDRVTSPADLPAGWTDEQEPGHYRLLPSKYPAFFGYSVGPQSWKKYLHPADVLLCSAEREGETFRILNNESQRKRPFAFLGVRACELAAIAVQDRVLLQDKFCDPTYAQRSAGKFIVAVQCTRGAATCFCKSMETGPEVTRGYDLVLTELLGPTGHRFLVKSGSSLGTEVLAELEVSPATTEDLHQMEVEVHRRDQGPSLPEF